MTEVPKDLINFGVRRQLDILRYGNSVVRDVLALLNAAEQEVVKAISKRGDTDTWTVRRLNALLQETSDLTFEAYIQAGKKLDKDMRDFASHEAEATEMLIASQVPASFSTVRPSDAQLAAIVSKEPITVGPDKKLLLEEIFEGLAASKEEAIRGAIRLGMVEGEGVDTMVRRLVGTRKAKYTDGIIERQRRGAAAIVRTVVNHTSNRAAQITYAENSDLVKGWVFMSTLDSRTTIQCASLSGTEWPIGEGPSPPRHPNCRSFALPKLKTFRELGVDIDEMPASTRASKDGPVKADISFDDWLKDQPVSVQKDILGTTRQQLFADGKMPLKEFADDKGRVFTLDQLEQRHRELFDNVFGPNYR